MSRRAGSLGFRSARSWIFEDSPRAGNVIAPILELSCLKAIEAISARCTKIPPGALENAPIIKPDGKLSFGFDFSRLA